MQRLRFPFALAATITVALAARADQNIVKNGSMENGPGPNGPDQRYAAGWSFFGGTTVERSNEANHTTGGMWSLKVFGGETTVGAYQDVPATPGQSVTFQSFLYSRGTDRIGGDAEAKIKLEFVDANQQSVGTPVELTVLNGGTPADTWVLGSIPATTVPAGAAAARATCVWTWNSVSSGSAYWDDAVLRINGGPNALTNSDFETPGTSGQSPFGIDFWTGFGRQEKSGDVAQDGHFSAKVGVGGQSADEYSGLFQNMRELAAGDHVFLRCFVFNPVSGGLNGTAAAAIKLEFSPGSGINLPPPEQALLFDQNSPNDQWVPVSYQTTVPNGATQARIVIVADDTSTTNGPVYVDSARAERSSAPGVNQLLNPSFELGSSGFNGITNWSEFRGPACTARKNTFEVPAQDGDSVVKISGSCVAGEYQDIAVAPGETLTISGYFRSRSDMPFADPNSRAGVKVEWRAGAVPPQIDIDGAPNNTLHAGGFPGQWTPLFIDYTMPPGSGALLRFTVIVARGNAPDAQVYFDSAEAAVRTRFNGADADADDDEDLLDFAELQKCFRGSGVTDLPWPGLVFDSDEDGDIDTVDSEFFFPRMTGPS